ncbi:ejaculatory bulb-specific protein 3-like [Onthophagus taurus]|uniref:ejaculatory bulb-specific protein 3-like n=1 Tax=Onthophagus taurus TaxID=166361 RepID=UPI000C20AAFB|nr:ejaculatory bulb-specific protein 3-like [Onthophagus taurus]
MKHILVVLFACVLAFAYARPDDKYTTKYDGVDLDAILKNKRLLHGYINCLLEKGPCSPDGTELKNNLPDAINNGCSKCSEKQREGGKKVLRFIIDNERAAWDELEKKYDPSGEYRKKYEAEAKKEGINL